MEKEKLKESWYDWRNSNRCYRTRIFLSTPLQLAVMTARIASNGKKIEPTIFKRKEKIRI